MINLLPPQQKRELLSRESRKIAITLGLVVLSSLLCFILILAFLKMYLLIQIDSQKNSLATTGQQLDKANAKALQEGIKDSNNKILGVKSFFDQKNNLGNIINDLSPKIPTGIYLTDISFSKASSQMLLAGFSPSQELLRQFKKNLESFYTKEKVTFPDDVWGSLTNINFSGTKINLKP